MLARGRAADPVTEGAYGCVGWCQTKRILSPLGRKPPYHALGEAVRVRVRNGTGTHTLVHPSNFVFADARLLEGCANTHC